MSRLEPGFHGRWEAADRAFAQFLDAIPIRRAELERAVRDATGLTLDGSVESLDTLNHWYIDVIAEDGYDVDDWWPVWLPPRSEAKEEAAQARGIRALPAGALRVWELVAVYVGDMVLAEADDTRWVCWRGSFAHDLNNAKPLIDQGFADAPCSPLGIANAGIPGAYAEAASVDELKAKTDPGALRAGFQKWQRNHARLIETEPRSWQREPNGRGAGTRVPTRPWGSPESGS